MHSVFIAFDPPMPPTGGGTRTYHMLKALSEVSISHLFLCFPVSIDQLPNDVQRQSERIDIAQHSFNSPLKGRLSTRTYQLLMAFLPFMLSAEEVIRNADYYVLHHSESMNIFKRWFHKRICNSLLKEAHRRYESGFQLTARTIDRIRQYHELESKLNESLKKADLLWIDFSYPLVFFKNIKEKYPNLKIICNAHNLEYLFFQRMGNAVNDSMQKEWHFLQSKFMKKIELEGFMECDEVFVCSDNDKISLKQELPDIRVTVVPNGVDTNYFYPHPEPVSVPTLLFTGTMTYAPNQDAVDHFVKNIFPLVKKEIPDCVFVLAGLHASRVFTEYKGRTDIQIVNSPVDIRPHYNRASLVVVPLRSGSGTRLKILEAMAMGKPVVSTWLGAEGIDAENGIHLFLASNEIEFVNHILFILNNRDEANEVSKACVNLAHIKYDWNNIRDRLKYLIKKYDTV